MANIEELDRAIKWVEENPNQHDQSTWGQRTPCGTTLCLFGTIGMLNGWTLCREDGKPISAYEHTSFVRNAEGEVRQVFDVAQELLQISEVDAESLSAGENTLRDIKTMRNVLAAHENLDAWNQ